MKNERKLLELLSEFNRLGISGQADYNKFYIYSIITHSTAIEGSTVTEVENRLLFDEGITAPGKKIGEQLMNLDLKNAYNLGIKLAEKKENYSLEMLQQLTAEVMKNTGGKFNTPLGSFDSSRGELRLVNVSAGLGGKSYLAFNKISDYLQRFCDWLNSERKKLPSDDTIDAYRLSFYCPFSAGNNSSLGQWERAYKQADNEYASVGASFGSDNYSGRKENRIY